MAGRASSSTSTTAAPPRSHPARAAIANSNPNPATPIVTLFKSNSRPGGSLVGDKFPGIIPGYRTSAAFLSSLSQNLRIPDDDYLPSPISTPPSISASPDPSNVLPPPSPLSMASKPADANVHSLRTADGASEPVDPLADVPPLSTFIATSEDDRLDGLKLVADSVAQQRQFASRILISHWLNASALAVVLAVVAQYLYKTPSDLALVGTTSGGILMAYLVLVRGLTAGYLRQAEDIGQEWLGDDTVLVTKFGDEVIGATVIGWDGGNEKGKSKKKRGGKGVIRAWTVRLRYRGKGEGVALLDEAVKVVKEKGGEGVEFEEDHIYSKRVIPAFYNGPFDKRDRRVQAKLDQVVSQAGAFGKKR